MYERILVPLDGTPIAEQALRPAASIARAAGAHLYLATAAIPSAMGLPELPYEASLGEFETEYLDEVANRVREAGVPDVSTKLLAGDDVVSQLEAHRMEVGAGLTVMASHGRGPVERAWLGSVTDRFVRTSEAPVLLVRADPDAESPDLTANSDFGRVLIPLDGSRLSRAAVGPAMELPRTASTVYILVRIIEPPRAIGSVWLPAAVELTEEQVEAARRAAEAELGSATKLVAERGCDVEPVAEFAAPVAKGILEIADGRGADLIAMATHGRGGAQRLMLGSVADKVIRGADCPVLVVRPGDE